MTLHQSHCSSVRLWHFLCHDLIIMMFKHIIFITLIVGQVILDEDDSFVKRRLVRRKKQGWEGASARSGGPVKVLRKKLINSQGEHIVNRKVIPHILPSKHNSIQQPQQILQNNFLPSLHHHHQEPNQQPSDAKRCKFVMF